MTRITLAALLAVASGCSTVQKIAPVDTSAASYRDDELNRPEMRQASIAVLPVRPGSGNTELAEAAGARVSRNLSARGLAMQVLPPAEVRERFERAGIAEEVEAMICALPESGQLDPKTLDAMGFATGCRFFVMTSITHRVSRDIANIGGAVHGSEAQSTVLYAQLWDASTGQVVWEGEGGGAALLGPPHFGSARITTTIAADGLARVLERAPHEVRDPDSVETLHARSHDEYARVAQTNAQQADACTGVVAMLEIIVAVGQLAR